MRRLFFVLTVLSMFMFGLSSCKCNKDAAVQDDAAMDEGAVEKVEEAPAVPAPAAPAVPTPEAPKAPASDDAAAAPAAPAANQADGKAVETK